MKYKIIRKSKIKQLTVLGVEQRASDTAYAFLTPGLRGNQEFSSIYAQCSMHCWPVHEMHKILGLSASKQQQQIRMN